ncbi:MAG: hypothetical protein K0U29_03865 [Gammaproteobacteria bacterium]|nr:hypothetical protein [Gammaproteobacteria bacterium]MCH9744050.1 hypothetical protein [Gammaproteobacteria bacterium]
MSREMFPNKSGGGAEAVPQVDLREETVGAQQRFEAGLAAKGKLVCSKTAAVFLVRNMLTPLFVNPDEVHQNDSGLWVVNEGCKLPMGLVTDEILSDPAKLSTVLGRAVTLRQVLDQGAHILILMVDGDRPTVDKSANVDDRNLEQCLEKYKQQIIVRQITQGEYEEYSDVRGVAAATYHYSVGGQRATCTIRAKQENAEGGRVRDWSHFCLVGEGRGDVNMHDLELSLTNKMLQELVKIDHISKLSEIAQKHDEVDQVVPNI